MNLFKIQFVKLVIVHWRLSKHSLGNGFYWMNMTEGETMYPCEFKC